MHSLIVAALLTLSKNHLLKDEDEDRTEQNRSERYVTKSFRTGVQRNGSLTRTQTKKLRANETGKSSRKACAKTPPRSVRTKGTKSNGYGGWFFGLFIPHSLSLSFLTGHPGHLAFPACFFWLARYMAKCVLRFSIAGNLTN
jgi:hypothetical protein